MAIFRRGAWAVFAAGCVAGSESGENLHEQVLVVEESIEERRHTVGTVGGRLSRTITHCRQHGKPPSKIHGQYRKEIPNERHAGPPRRLPVTSRQAAHSIDHISNMRTNLAIDVLSRQGLKVLGKTAQTVARTAVANLAFFVVYSAKIVCGP